MIQIITDSASDITSEQANKMQVHIVPLTITFQDGNCSQETEEDFNLFYKKLVKSKELPVTSQPAPGLYLRLLKQAKIAGDEVLVITLSGGLSGTIQSARLAKQLADYDKIEVVDSRQAILTQRMLVQYAVWMREKGKKLDQIVRELKDLRDRLRICGMLDTLTYLKKGGRIPASMALLGNVLRIKPIIVLEEKELKQLGKARGKRDGLKMLEQELQKADLDPHFPVYFGYTVNEEPARAFQKEMKQKYGLRRTACYPVGGVIGTHVGPNCIALAFVTRSK